jgi:hypothetical protein
LRPVGLRVPTQVVVILIAAVVAGFKFLVLPRFKPVPLSERKLSALMIRLALRRLQRSGTQLIVLNYTYFGVL